MPTAIIRIELIAKDLTFILPHNRDREGQVTTLRMPFHLKVPTALVVLDNRRKSRAAGLRRHEQGRMRGARGLPPEFNQAIKIQSLRRILVGRNGSQNECIASGIYAHVVSILRDQGIAKRVEAGLEGLTAKVRRCIREMYDPQQSSRREPSVDDIAGTAGTGAGRNGLPQPQLAKRNSLVVNGPDPLGVEDAGQRRRNVAGRGSTDGLGLVAALGVNRRYREELRRKHQDERAAGVQGRASYGSGSCGT